MRNLAVAPYHFGFGYQGMDSPLATKVLLLSFFPLGWGKRIRKVVDAEKFVDCSDKLFFIRVAPKIISRAHVLDEIKEVFVVAFSEKAHKVLQLTHLYVHQRNLGIRLWGKTRLPMEIE
jgi:hypothetical protein